MIKKIVITHQLNEEVMKSLKEKFDVRVANSGDPKEIFPLIKDANGIIVRIGYLDKETIVSLDKLEVIGRTGVGVDNIDIKVATEKGIPVVVTPGANTRSVAEHTLAFICALSKDLKVNDLEVHKGNYGIRNTCKAFEFLDKNLGLIGFGNIGKEVAKLCSSIGLNVSVYDPLVSSETVENEGYKFINNLDELISESDIITVHVPLVEETRGLIGLNEFSLMKTNVIIVNCARGGIVDQAALTEALENKTIGGVGLDVFASEPLDEDDPILKFDNVITTPHIAGLTKEAFYSMSKMVADGVESILSGKQWPYVANKEVYKCKKWKE